jgi:pyruvate/2-oxoglutarate dehydrogenase complex dihydrolipoamide acyltransferase (E2) component
METSIVVPELGLNDLRFGLWLVSVGETVREGERIAELSSSVATVELASPASGRLKSREAFPGDRLATGSVLGWIESTERDG